MTLRESALRIHEAHPVVDGHNDLPWALRAAGHRDLVGIDLLEPQTRFHTDIPRLVEGGVGLQFWSVWVPASDATPLRSTLEQVDLVHRLAARYPGHLSMAPDARTVRDTIADGRTACMLGAEGGHSIEGSIGALRALFRLGVRYLTLTHTRTTDWADSATDEKRHAGLAPFGLEVVAEMNRLGMLVDISHCSAETMRAAVAASKAPVIASHSSAYALAPHPRNVPDDVIEGVAARGGVVMVCFYPPFVVRETAVRAVEMLERERALRAGGTSEEEITELHEAEWAKHPPDVGTVSDVADHIEHIARVAGVDHVGVGSDYDGMSLAPVGLEDVSCFPNLTVELLQRGWNRPDILKVLGENALRVIEEAELVAQTTSDDDGGDTRVT